ncbi:unnamed protein product [Choristocarpus tenellus]
MEKTWCGRPRKRVALCCVAIMVIVVIVIIVVMELLRSPDDIDTVEKNDPIASATELSILKTAVFAGANVNATISLLQLNEDGSHLLALNDFSVASDCAELEIRLSQALLATDTLRIPLPSGASGDFTQPISGEAGVELNVDLYDQVALWCAPSDGTEEKLTTTGLFTPSTVAGSIVAKEGTFSGAGSYTSEGLVQIVGIGSIKDGALVTTYMLRFQEVEVSSGPDVFLYLTTDPENIVDVDAEGSLTVLVDGAERGTFSFTGNFTQAVPTGFVSPENFVAAVVWCDQFDVLFGSAALVNP